MNGWLRYKSKNLIYRFSNKNIPRLSWNPHDHLDSGYCSQYGQDRFIAEKLGFKRNGIFIDIGANDGITLSNSCFFEKHLDWTGVAVEPLPKAFQKLSINRNCKLAEYCVSDIDGTVKFLHCDVHNGMLSGIVSKLHPKHIRAIDKMTDVLRCENKIIQVDSITPEQLLREHAIDKIDYLSVDTEGGELDILRGFDFNAVVVHFVTVENNHYDLKIRKYMRQSGFRLIALAGVDEIYENTATHQEMDRGRAA